MAGENESVGNAVKMREALASLIRTVNDFVVRVDYYGIDSYYLECYEKHKETLSQEIGNAKSALATPPRNCDKYSHDEALQVWASGKENERNGCFDEWLYEIAKEGGAK